MSENTERNLLAVSIKHTEYRWKFGMPCVLWGQRTKDDEKTLLRWIYSIRKQCGGVLVGGVAEKRLRRHLQSR